MTDQDRRSEILKAEAAVRLLAEELARVKQTHLAAEKVARSLATAQAALEQSAGASQTAVQRVTEEAFNRLAATQVLLEQSHRANQGAVQAVEACAREARASLEAARSRLEAVESQVRQRSNELRTTVERIDGLAPLLQNTVEQSMSGMLKEMESLRCEHGSAAEASRRRMASVGRLIIALVVLALLSIGGTVACLILLLIRSG
jgi:hypothetical protein